MIDNYSPSQQEPRGPCVKCGHDGQYLDRGGACWALREKEDDRIQVHCGCQCVFPRATEGLTVEAVLKELREMLPHRDIQISWSGWSWQYPSKYFKDGYKAKIEIGALAKFEAETLDEAMQQVRAWAKSRAEKERSDHE